jgi:hypothetical protein
LKRVLEMPTLVLHGDSDIALGEELLDGIEAAVPDVSLLRGWVLLCSKMLADVSRVQLLCIAMEIDWHVVHVVHIREVHGSGVCCCCCC